MKALLVNGSPRKAGNTSTALAEVAKALEGEGIATDTFWIGAKPVRGCAACGACRGGTPGRCAFADDACNALIERLRAAGLQMSGNWQLATGNLEGMTLVVSGVFEHFSRDEIKADIESHGGKVSGSISGKTTYLVAGEKMGPEKLKKAEKLGVKIISEAEYIEMTARE